MGRRFRGWRIALPYFTALPHFTALPYFTALRRFTASGRLAGPGRGARSVAGRILGSMLLLSLLTLLVAGGTSYGILSSQAAARIDDALSRTVNEFRVLSASSVDPSTGAPFARAEDLVYVAMQRTLPAANEGMMALGPADVRWVAPESVSLRPEQDRQLLDRLLAEAPQERAVLRTLSTGTTTYRLAVLPVQLAGDAAPMRYVVAFDLRAELAALGRTHLVFLAAGLAALALSAVLGWMLVARLLAPLREMRRTAEAISEHDLGQRLEVRGNDDLADLSATFNHMLDRLGNALRSQRQLLDDVGHELRTPITIVQGHLELQDAADPHDVEQTRGIALDELDRMSLLVDDLVMLAKADRSDFVAPVPVELDVLIDDVLDKARGLGGRRWTVEGRVHGTAELDPRRIEQAMLQLCQNAVKFSAGGSTVALGCRLHGNTLRLSVRDEGIGVLPGDRAAIFERFARGSNGRRAGGSGLGLTIVRAIAAAHGGTAGVESRPGAGSTFFIDLPLRRFGPLQDHTDNTVTGTEEAHEPDPDH
ncbi:two-component sensor histidine kinase [Zafaria cholistanensis]|uniref:histidine kinase n=1 Tax=Zafaria cholistanensis TaxID=1682741 RepID=A0A5A7NMP2_9MICC|nr:HAMP domain-containing sensor histidine kinase [Zafaria cholistanensis]GER21766.1 two-component sensor histidine kinase [Zafaria cholistanensis]